MTTKFNFSCKQDKQNPCGPSVSGVGDKAEPQDLTDMSATDFCKKAEKKATNIFDSINSMFENNPVSKLIDALGGKAETSQELLNKINVNIKTDTIAKLTQSCTNSVISNQTNSITQEPWCFKAAKQAFPNDATKRAEMLSLSNINQSNISKIGQECKLAAISKALTSMSASVDNEALQKVLAKASGIGAKADSKQRTCNVINQNMKACKYVSQKQCCVNSVQSDQLNRLKICGGKFINQSNALNVIQSCSTSAESQVSDSLINAITNKSSQSATLVAKGFPVGALIAILIIAALFILMPVLLPVFVGGEVMGKIMKFIGPVLLILGTVLIVFYFTTKEKEINRINKPFSTCPDDKSSTTDKPMRMKFGDIKAEMENDTSIIGYDFFVDDINIEKPGVNDMGLAVFFTGVDRTSTCDQNDTTKSKCFTYIKPHSNNLLLAFGIMIIIGGIVQIGYSAFKSKKSIKSIKSTKYDKKR